MASLYIIAGCNGAGKTTAAYNLLPKVFNTIEFVNADEIARGLSPFNRDGVVIKAGKIMLERIKYLYNNKKDFAFETTLSGLIHLNFIKLAKQHGYDVVLLFIWLNAIELAKERVAVRVSKGGHNVLEKVIERRYKKGHKNLEKYISEADDWYIYDNSGAEYELIAKNIGGKKDIFNFEVFNKVIKDE